MERYSNEEMQKAYLKGYQDGFLASLKVAWSMAEDLFIAVDNSAKDKVREFIDKLTH